MGFETWDSNCEIRKKGAFYGLQFILEFQPFEFQSIEPIEPIELQPFEFQPVQLQFQPVEQLQSIKLQLQPFEFEFQFQPFEFQFKFQPFE